MIKLILILNLLIFSGALFATEQNADAVFLKMLKEYTLKEDGTVVYHQNHQLKLLTYNAFNRHYGETFLIYDTLRQKLKINHSVTTMADGKKVPSPDNAYNLLLPRFARNVAAYNYLREMVITHTALERNAVIDLDYEIESKKDFLPGLMGNTVLAQDSPVNELTVRISLPSAKALQFKLFNSSVKPVVKTTDGQTILEWKFKNLPAIVYEPQRSNPGDFAPRLVFSSLGDFEQASALIPLKPTVAHEVVKALLPDTLSVIEQIFKAQEYVVNNMAAVPVPLSAAGFRYRSPDEVWQSNSGTPLEKANLLAAALIKSGVKARAVLVCGQDMFDGQVPALQVFNKAALCVHLPSGQSFMLSVEELNKRDLKYNFAGRAMLVFDPQGIKLLKVPAPETGENKSILQANIKINAEGKSSGTLNTALKGAANPYLAIQRNEGDTERLLKEIIKDSKQTRLISLSPGGLEVQGKFENNADSKEQGDFLFYNLPENPNGIASLHLSTWSTVRNTPLRLPYNGFCENSTFNIETARGLHIINKEIDIAKENSTGSLKIKFTKTDSGLKIERVFKLKKQLIGKEEYAGFFELWRLWQALTFKQIIVKKI